MIVGISSGKRVVVCVCVRASQRASLGKHVLAELTKLAIIAWMLG